MRMPDRKVAAVWIATVLLSLAANVIGVRAEDPVDVAKAKAEGKVVWYTSTPIDEAQRIAQAFRAETGITVELFRSGGSQILSRFQQELSAGRIAADVLTHSDPAAARAMAKKGMFVPFKPKNFENIPDAAKAADGAFIGQRLNMMTHYLRSDKVAPADEPRSWDDLTAARFKGKLAMADPSFTSLQVSVIGMIAKLHGWSFYEKLRENDAMIVPGNQQVADLLKRGERLIAVGGLDSYAADLKTAGHPIKTLYPSDGVFIIPSPTSVVKGSPHPEAAKLFAQFMISDTVQDMFPADGGYSARIDIRAPAGSPDLKSLKVIAIDDDYIERESARIKKQFNEIFQ
ncbi:MAG TPA: extracellular solute-binding protein [Xanthobacteraceae bacterium]|nr:extracellular solute-binding protein [Xanthobacteraceae bacterium]